MWLHCPPTCIGRRRPSCGFRRRGRAPAPASPHSPPPRHLNLCDDMPGTALVASVSTSATPLQRRNTLGEKPSVYPFRLPVVSVTVVVTGVLVLAGGLLDNRRRCRQDA